MTLSYGRRVWYRGQGQGPSGALCAKPVILCQDADDGRKELGFWVRTILLIQGPTNSVDHLFLLVFAVNEAFAIIFAVDERIIHCNHSMKDQIQTPHQISSTFALVGFAGRHEGRPFPLLDVPHFIRLEKKR